MAKLQLFGIRKKVKLAAFRRILSKYTTLKYFLFKCSTIIHSFYRKEFEETSRKNFMVIWVAITGKATKLQNRWGESLQKYNIQWYTCKLMPVFIIVRFLKRIVWEQKRYIHYFHLWHPISRPEETNCFQSRQRSSSDWISCRNRRPQVWSSFLWRIRLLFYNGVPHSWNYDIIKVSASCKQLIENTVLNYLVLMTFMHFEIFFLSKCMHSKSVQ